MIPPGRELDALVAEKVMGEKVYETDDCNGEDNFWLDAHSERELPPYSTDIAAAWEVVEKINLLYGLYLTSEHEGKYKRWRVEIFGHYASNYCLQEEYVSEAISAPHAICLAALKSKGHAV